MSPILVGILGIVALVVMILSGLPVGVTMGVLGVAGLAYLISVESAVVKIGYTAWDTIANYDLACLPLFILMANVVFASGLSSDLYAAAVRWVGHWPGGLAMATVIGSAIFAAISASSLATALTIGPAAIAEMRAHKYHPAMAAGCVAAAGTMGALIPPSGTLIIYGSITGNSIGQLFMAGLVPGILEAVFYMATIYIVCRRKPEWGPRGPKFGFRDRIVGLARCIDVLLLVAVIMGGLIGGLFTPTEAGAIGACTAIVFSLIRRRLTWQAFRTAIKGTLKTTGMIYCILIGAMVFKYFAAVTTLPTIMADSVAGLAWPSLAVLAVILVMYLFLGALMDPLAMILLTLPVFYPTILALGFDPIWWGIILVRMTEIAAITPPVGMNVFAVAGIAKDVPMTTIFKGVTPFLVSDVCNVALLVLIPSVVLWLPHLLY